MSYILSFVNGQDKPINLYKINSQTGKKVLVGSWDRTTGVIEYLEPKKSISELCMTNINQYNYDYELEELEIYITNKRDIISERNDGNTTYDNSLSLGYFDKGKLVLWSQYE